MKNKQQMDEAAMEGLRNIYKMYLNNNTNKDKTIALLVIGTDIPITEATKLLDMAIQLNKK